MSSPDGRASFDKILNLRDVGQQINHLNGNVLIKPGLLFRSARPDAATPSDRLKLARELKIRTVVDLRSKTEHIEQTGSAAAEILSAPAETDVNPKKVVRISEIVYKDISLNGSGYSSALIKQLTYGQKAQLFTLYALRYRKAAISVLGKNVMAARGLDGLAQDSLTYSKAEVKDVFSVLCNPESYPVLVHCTQGKDRTGLVCLLVLLLCGVPREAISKDYCLSEKELEPEREEKLLEIGSIGLPEAFADCPEDWVEKVCDFIDVTFGGVEKYLESCGITDGQQASLGELMGAA